MSVKMINAEGFGMLVSRRQGYVNVKEVEEVYRGVFGAKSGPQLPEGTYAYKFTSAEMNEIFTAVGVPPFNRGHVMKLLSNGKV